MELLIVFQLRLPDSCDSIRIIIVDLINTYEPTHPLCGPFDPFSNSHQQTGLQSQNKLRDTIDRLQLQRPSHQDKTKY